MPADAAHVTGSLPGERRHALVIGTSDYFSPHYANLPGAVDDAHDMRDVLADPAICGFGAVRMLINEPVEKIRRAVNEIFDDGRSPDDLVLVYLSCHGVRDFRGRLHLTATDTEPGVRAATTVSARELKDMADDCPARRKVIIIDSCYSGAFGAKAGEAHDLTNDFGDETDSRGLTVLTASRSAEYAFTHRRSDGAPAGSVFTTALVEGLRTGRADLRNSGWITVEDAYRYAHTVVRRLGHRQTPQIRMLNAEGADAVLARSPAGVRAGEPDIYQLVRDLDRPHPKVRRAAVETLGDLLHDDNPAVVQAARKNLKFVLETDRSPELVNLAKAMLAGEDGPDPGIPIDDLFAPAPASRPRSSRPANRRPTPRFVEMPVTPYDGPADFDLDPPPDPDFAPSPGSADEQPTAPSRPGHDYTDHVDEPNREPPPDADFLTADDFAGLRDATDPLGVFGPRRVTPIEPEPSWSVSMYLFPTERFRGEWRRHWIVPIASAAAAGIASGLAWHPLHGQVPLLPTHLAGVPVALALRAVLLLAAAAAAWRTLAWHRSRIVLTNKRILLVRGILLRRTVSTDLRHLTNIRSSVTPLGRLLGYGTLSFNAGRVLPQRIRYVPWLPEIYLRTIEEIYEPAAVEARLSRVYEDEAEGV